jgi:hypothetical protein
VTIATRLAAVLVLALPAAAAATHPCEAEVSSLASQVTRLEYLVGADRDVVAGLERTGGEGSLVHEAQLEKLRKDQAELDRATQELLQAQDRCSQLLRDEARAAERPAEPQVALDLSLGVGFSSGNAQQLGPENPTVAMSSEVMPISAVLGLSGRWLFTPNLSAGLYAQWNPGAAAANPAFLSVTCGSGSAASCFAWDLRVGLQVAWAFLPERRGNPWVSLGSGWEWTRYQATQGGASQGVTWSGWEIVNVQAGVDFGSRRTATFGPFVGFAGGIYSNFWADLTWGPMDRAVDTTGRAFHGWFQFGVRGTLAL